MTDLLVPARFCGPPISGNGGWTAGAMAELVHVSAGDGAELRDPPPHVLAVRVEAPSLGDRVEHPEVRRGGGARSHGPDAGG